MKKIVSLILLVSLVVFAFASCGKKDPEPQNNEKDYTLAIGMSVSGDTSDNARNNGKIGANVAVLVLDTEGKIVAARLDTIEYKVKSGKGENVTLNLTAPTSKMELGTDYGMEASANKGEWDTQVKWLETYLVGKTAAQVAAMTDADIAAGCTIKSTTPGLKEAMANAFASTSKTAFKAEGTFTVGAKLTMSVSKTEDEAVDYTVAVDAEAAGVVVQNSKVVAATLDSAQTTMVANSELTATAFTYKANASKRAQGTAYDQYSPMKAGTWYVQADAFCAATVGKTATEIATVSAAGCTMFNSPATFKANIAAAMGLAR